MSLSAGARVSFDMPMSTQTRKHTARIKRTITTKQTVDALQPAEKPYIAWDDRLVGFGVRVLPSGTKSFILNYRPGGGRKAPNRRIVLGRCERTTPDRARHMAEEMLVRIAAGEDPAAERAKARAMPTLREAFEEFLAAGPGRKAGTVAVYRRNFHRHLGSLLERPLDTITARDVEQCFSRLTAEAGWVPANNAVRMLRSLYRRRCIDVEGLHNPVDQWRAAGGRSHRQRSRRIPPPAEVLPCWHRGIETAVRNRVARDAFRFGLYTGMRRDQVLGLRWAQVDMNAMTFRVEETGTGEPLELPVTRQAGAILERRLAERGRFSGQCRLWVFPSESSPSGRLHRMQHLNARIGEAGGARFWFHALRTCFIAVAEHELELPGNLTGRLVNSARPRDVTGGHAADWTMEQLREGAQRIADRIDELAGA